MRIILQKTQGSPCLQWLKQCIVNEYMSCICVCKNWALPTIFQLICLWPYSLKHLRGKQSIVLIFNFCVHTGFWMNNFNTFLKNIPNIIHLNIKYALSYLYFVQWVTFKKLCKDLIFVWRISMNTANTTSTSLFLTWFAFGMVFKTNNVLL